MSAQQADVGGLSKAHLRIVTLLDDLNTTVESVEQLTRNGEHEEALRVVEDQRSALSAIIDSISQDVCARGPSMWQRARRHAVALAAAAALALSSVAVSVGVLAGGDDADPPAGVERAPARRAHEPPRPGSIGEVPEKGSQGVPVVPGRDRESDDPLDEFDPDDIAPDPNGGGGLIERGDQLATDVGKGRPPPPPQSGENPVETVNGVVRTSPDWGTAEA